MPEKPGEGARKERTDPEGERANALPAEPSQLRGGVGNKLPPNFQSEGSIRGKQDSKGRTPSRLSAHPEGRSFRRKPYQQRLWDGRARKTVFPVRQSMRNFLLRVLVSGLFLGVDQPGGPDLISCIKKRWSHGIFTDGGWLPPAQAEPMCQRQKADKEIPGGVDSQERADQPLALQ